MKKVIYPLLLASGILFSQFGCTPKASNQSEKTTDTLSSFNLEIPKGVYIGLDNQEGRGTYLVKVKEDNRTELIYLPMHGDLHFTEYGVVDSLSEGGYMINTKGKTRNCLFGVNDLGLPTLTFQTKEEAGYPLIQIKDDKGLFDSLKELTYKDDVSGEFIRILPELRDGVHRIELCGEEKGDRQEKIFISEDENAKTYVCDESKLEIEGNGAKITITDPQGEKQTMTLISPLFGKYMPIGEEGSDFFQIGLVDIPSGRVAFCVQSNGLISLAPMKESWAKGAVYEHQSIKFTFKGDKVTVQEDGKEVKLQKVE